MISVVICSVDAGKFRRVCESYNRAFAGEPFEIIGLHDARGLAEAYNRGAARARGELIIFSHDDIEILSADFKDRLLGHMRHADLVGVAGASRLIDGSWVNACPPYTFGQIATLDPAEKLFKVWIWGTVARRVDGIKALDGVFLCANRRVVQSVPFDQHAFDRFHGYDIDFTFRAHRKGFRLAVGCDLSLLHHSTGTFDAEFMRCLRIFSFKHAGELDVLSPRIGYQMCIVTCRTRDELPEVMTPIWPEQ